MNNFRESMLSVQSNRLKASSLTLALFLGVMAASNSRATAQEITVAPDAQSVFLFAGPEGGPFYPQTTTTWNLKNLGPQSADFAVSSSQPWLSVSPSTGTLGGILNSNVGILADLVDIQAEALAAGVYTATVSFTNLTNGNGNTERTVRLEIAPASFSVDPSFVTTSINVNGGNPAAVSVTLTNSGQLDLNYGLSWSGNTWMSVSKNGGTVRGGSTDSFAVSFNVAGLSAGTYFGEIEIKNTTNGAGSRTLPVALTIKSIGASSMVLTPDTDIGVSGPVGNIPLFSQSYKITNDSEKSVRWNVVTSDSWISVSPSSGELAPFDGAAGGLDEKIVTVRINAAAQTLPPGAAAATATFQTITINPITSEVTGVAFAARAVHVVANPVLTLSAPAVGGIVTTSPEGTALPGSTNITRRLTFNFGEVIVVTAAPSDGYEFRGWAGNYPDDAQLVNPLILPMDSSKSLGALIAPILRTLTLSTLGAGTGTIDMSPTGAEIENALEARYTNGTTVELFAEADAGSIFRGWSGNVPQGMELANPLTLLMDRDRVISARFEPAISLTVNVQSGGSILVDPDLPAYAAGMVVTLSAIADSGHVFAGWSGAATGTNPSTTITLIGDTVITASFAETDPGDPGDPGEPTDPNVARLTVRIEGDGLVTPNGGDYVKGATVTVIATPTVTSQFVRWELDASGTALATTVLMDRHKTVRAVFEATTGTGGEDPGPRPNPGPSTCGAAGMIGFAGMLVGWIALTFTGTKSRRPSLIRRTDSNRN